MDIRVWQRLHNYPINKQKKILDIKSNKADLPINTLYYRAKEVPPYHNIVLGECIKKG